MMWQGLKICVFRRYTWRGTTSINYKVLCAASMDRLDEQLPPDTIYGFGSDPYKEDLTELQGYKALLVFPTWNSASSKSRPLRSLSHVKRRDLQSAPS